MFYIQLWFLAYRGKRSGVGHCAHTPLNLDLDFNPEVRLPLRPIHRYYCPLTLILHRDAKSPLMQLVVRDGCIFYLIMVATLLVSLGFALGPRVSLLIPYDFSSCIN